MKRLKKLSKRPRTSGLLVACLGAVVLLTTASAASAVTYRPTRTDDPRPDGCKAKDCSLREAVIASNAGSVPATILLRPGKRYVLTRQGAGMDADRGDLNITSSGPLTVKTKGGGKTNPATIDANRIDRIFDGSLTLIGVTLRDGFVGGDTGVGGAIRGGILDIRNSRLISNAANGHGIFPANGGAIFVNSGGELSIAGTRLKGNKATGAGGAIFISKGGSASLFKSTLARNESGGFGGGLGIDAGGSAEVNRSTISDNKMLGGIGDFSSGGGIGIYAPSGGPTATLEVENSTVANNSAGLDGGGIGSQDSIDSGSHATMELDHVTVARNQAWTGHDIENGTHGGTGGGIFSARGDSVSIHNTVVALNTVATHHRPAHPSDCSLFFRFSPLPLAGAQPDRHPRGLHRLRPHRPVRRKAGAGEARRQRRAHQDDRADEGFEGDRPRGARRGSRRPAWR